MLALYLQASSRSATLKGTVQCCLGRLSPVAACHPLPCRQVKADTHAFRSLETHHFGLTEGQRRSGKSVCWHSKSVLENRALPLALTKLKPPRRTDRVSLSGGWRRVVFLFVEGAGVHLQVHRPVAAALLPGHGRAERGGVPLLHPGAAHVRPLLPVAGEQGVGGAFSVTGEWSSSPSSGGRTSTARGFPRGLCL